MFFVWDVQGTRRPLAGRPAAARRRSGAITSVESVAPGTEARSQKKKAAAAYQRADQPKAPRQRAFLAKDIMSSPVMTLESGMPLTRAWSLIREKRFRHIPIVDARKVLVGILSDRDLLQEAADAANSLLGEEKKAGGVLLRDISDVMTTNVISTVAETPIRDIARVLFDHRIGAMPIVDADGAVVGLVTRSDILRTLVHDAPVELWM
ncbi:MAG: CBS domain-containing protein [Bdellovibrionales bacterium]|nr:CBS domain-containing protein [Bdellovibrionales bacterium]